MEGLTAKVRRAMEHYLFDPFSAQYRTIRSGRGGAVCGEYNAKNRLGAYTGFRDFVLSRDGRTIYASSYNDGVRNERYSSFAEAYINACATAAEASEYRRATGIGNPADLYRLDYDGTDEVPDPTEGARRDLENAEQGYDD
jgi:hypothetical protein